MSHRWPATTATTRSAIPYLKSAPSDRRAVSRKSQPRSARPVAALRLATTPSLVGEHDSASAAPASGDACAPVAFLFPIAKYRIQLRASVRGIRKYSLSLWEWAGVRA